MIRDMWHMTHDMWQMVEGDQSLNISAPLLLRFEFADVLKVWRKRITDWLNELMNEWISNKSVCRTAPATQGLLITHFKYVVIHTSHSVHIKTLYRIGQLQYSGGCECSKTHPHYRHTVKNNAQKWSRILKFTVCYSLLHKEVFFVTALLQICLVVLIVYSMVKCSSVVYIIGRCSSIVYVMKKCSSVVKSMLKCSSVV